MITKRGKIIVFMQMICFALLLAACNDTDTISKTTYKQNKETNVTESNIQYEKIKSILFKSEYEVNGINHGYTREVVDKEIIANFEQVLKLAEKQNGIYDMTNPNIEVKLKHYTGEETNLLIWDNEENDKVSIMDEKDTHTLYTIDKEYIQFFYTNESEQ